MFEAPAVYVVPDASIPEEDGAVLSRAQAVLSDVRRWHDAARPRVRQYRAGRDMVFGDQYGGMVTGRDGLQVTKADYLASMGRKADAFNLIEPVVRQLEGQFRQNRSERDLYPEGQADAEAVRALNIARRTQRRQNASAELEADVYQTHLIGGFCGFRSTIERATSGPFPVTVAEYAVHPARLFHNLDVTDRRMRELRLVGQLHDLAPADVARRFARDEADVGRVLGYYGLPADWLDNGGRYATDATGSTYGFRHFDALGFDSAEREGALRVVEAWVQEPVWTAYGLDPLALMPEAGALEAAMPGLIVLPQGEGPLPEHLLAPGALEAVNGARMGLGLPPVESRGMELTPVWHYYFLTPEGFVLRHGRTGYWHGEHPFTIGQARCIDGETWGVVKALVAPQQWFNARMGDLDHAIRTGGKSMAVWDEQILRDSGFTLADVAELRARGDTDIALKRGGTPWAEVFKELPPTAIPPGLADVATMMPGLIERIGGVSEAAQGLAPKSGTTATQYERQNLQAGVMAAAYQDTYFETLARKDQKDVRLLQQAIDRPTAFHDMQTGRSVEYDPAKARALRFNVAVGAAADTPTQALAYEQMLREDVALFGLPPEVYYARSGRPDAPLILQDLQAWQQQQAEAAMQAAALLPDGADGAAPALPM